MLALAPQAYGQSYDLAMPCEPQWLCLDGESEDAPPPQVAIVSVRGPLMHHVQPWRPGQQEPPPDCYDDIRARVAFALRMTNVCAIVLAIDSPGGLVNGCFDNARMVRAMADAAGVPIHAYVEGQCCSAAYAWACVCDTITAPATATVGSIGVLDVMLDATAADRAMGLKFALIASGARKTDGNPHGLMTDEAVAAAQSRVDEFASFFFDFVAEHRNITAESVGALQAEIFTGSKAQALQLVDNVMTLDALVASLTEDPTGKNTMAKYDSSMAALVAEADSDDPKIASRAKRAIAAMYAEGDDEETPPKKKDEEASAAAESDEETAPTPKKKDEEATRAAAAPSAVVASAAVSSDIDARLARIEDSNRQERLAVRARERKTLLASRPDLSPAMLAVLSDPKQTPLESLRAILPTIAQPSGAPAAVAATAAPTIGGDPKNPANPAADRTVERDGYTLDELDMKMGIYKPKLDTHWDGAKFIQPLLTPAQARAQIAMQRAQSQNGGAK